MHLMGSITKKLVVTPAHDIGVRRPRTYSVTAAASSNTSVPMELLQAMSRQQQMGLNQQGDGEEEEEVMFMEG